MKTFKSILLFGLFWMISLGASAADIPNDEIWYTSSSGKVTPYVSNAFGANIVSNTYTNGKGIIKFDGNVTSIGRHAFNNCSRLTSVTIPNSVTSIGNYAFYECSGLTNVTIPNSVTSIGEEAFYYCSGLTNVTIPNSVTSIGSSAFYHCSRLTSVTIPNSVTEIGGYAFSGCSGLTSVTIPNSVTTIGEHVFSGCSGLTSVTIPNSVTSIGSGAFYGCSGLTSVVINIVDWANKNVAATTSGLSDKSFFYTYNGKNIEGDYTIPDGLTKIGKNALYHCKDITKLTIGNSVTSIGDFAFSDCSSLTSVTIPNSVTSIGSSAFEYCSGLTSVTIPNSVTEIGEYAFSSCSGLTSIIVESSNTVYDSRDNCNAIIETKSNTLISGCKNTTIPNSVTEIGDRAFYGCSGLTSVTIPNSVTSIGYGAFYDCSGLTSIKVHWKRPLSIDASVWKGVDKQKCTLYVPEGTWSMYCSAPAWMEFVNIEEFSEEPEEEIYLTIMGVNGVILQQVVEKEKTYKYLLDNKKNGKIVTVTFNGEDVTSDVADGKYTTPKITGNSEVYVEYDNQPLGDTNLDGSVNVNDITKTAEIILLRAKAEMEAKNAIEATAEP